MELIKSCCLLEAKLQALSLVSALNDFVYIWHQRTMMAMGIATLADIYLESYI